MTEQPDAPGTVEPTDMDPPTVDQADPATPGTESPEPLINIHPNTPPVRGYRDLTQAEVDLINEIKAQGEQLGQLVDKVRATDGVDQRWASIAATDMQTGLMALVRAVAQPTNF
ncbi:hypothetical protein GCM10010174_70000 [Kutzneria viridogrisea]|uniref:Acb2/Tad1 hairpin domain-containing protein n=1 Tax=Kutzneria viridogrisea TaxID=47990 RepID=A0ABR6BBB4_9PSEU|nr:hypothetical protein [Kutzneria viridogrisea]